jgi:BlaI family penicillinase repressor
MAKPNTKITDSELAILEILWREGECTIRSLADELHPGGGVSEYATVQILLQRLEKKGCVRRDTEKRAHVYRATAQRGEVVAGHLQQLADRMFGGSLTPLVTHLVELGNLSKKDREALRELLEETAPGTKKPT